MGQWFDRVLTFENGRMTKSEEPLQEADDTQRLVRAG
jgi:hypothetical protein